MSQLQRESCVLLDDQDRHPFFDVELSDHVEDLQHDQRGEAERGFVEQQEFGTAQQCAGDRQHLLLAAGERSAQLVFSFTENRKQLVGVVDVLFDPRLVVARVGPEFEVLQHGEPRKNLAAFGRLAQPQPNDLMRRQVLNLAAR